MRAVALLLLLPSCASPAASDPTATSAGTATLLDDGCAFESADQAIGQSGFTIAAVNGTPDPGGFDLYRLHADTTYADWVSYNEEAQVSFEQGGEGPGDPVSIADPIDLQVAVGAGATGRLEAPSGDGVYALQCWRFPAEGVGNLWSAGPIVIGAQPP